MGGGGRFRYPESAEDAGGPWANELCGAQDSLQFFLGPRGSGSHAHRHDAAFNVCIRGRKRWFLFPPRAEHSAYLRGNAPSWARGYGSAWQTPALTWFREAYPALEERLRPLECVQEAGEAVFVPGGWGHAVLNLETSVGVAVQAGIHTSLRRELEQEARRILKD
mmetsp:Transcript_9673/g.31673  ORF Transcript_9673/g.31673 Transcript_9673/m.31673 type:complete len:165 (+) Transcript_9673:155-649(+)